MDAIELVKKDFPSSTNAKVAQLVEHDLAKVGVAGSNPVFRSTLKVIGEKNEDNSFRINRLEAIFF